MASPLSPHCATRDPLYFTIMHTDRDCYGAVSGRRERQRDFCLQSSTLRPDQALRWSVASTPRRKPGGQRARNGVAVLPASVSYGNLLALVIFCSGFGWFVIFFYFLFYFCFVVALFAFVCLLLCKTVLNTFI